MQTHTQTHTPVQFYSAKTIPVNTQKYITQENTQTHTLTSESELLMQQLPCFHSPESHQSISNIFSLKLIFNEVLYLAASGKAFEEIFWDVTAQHISSLQKYNLLFLRLCF